MFWTWSTSLQCWSSPAFESESSTKAWFPAICSHSEALSQRDDSCQWIIKVSLKEEGYQRSLHHSPLNTYKEEAALGGFPVQTTRITNKLIPDIVNHCLSNLKTFWPTCHWCIRSRSGFTIYQVPISTPLQWSVWFLWPQPVWRLQAGFSLTLLWPGFHFPPEAASPTVMGVDKQVDKAAIVVPGATTNLREGGGEGEREGERGERHSRAQADWQEPLTQPYWSHANQCYFFPSAGMAYFWV